MFYLGRDWAKRSAAEDLCKGIFISTIIITIYNRLPHLTHRRTGDGVVNIGQNQVRIPAACFSVMLIQRTLENVALKIKILNGHRIRFEVKTRKAYF